MRGLTNDIERLNTERTELNNQLRVSQERETLTRDSVAKEFRSEISCLEIEVSSKQQRITGLEKERDEREELLRQKERKMQDFMKEAQRVIDSTVDRVISELKQGDTQQRSSSGGRAASGVRGGTR